MRKVEIKYRHLGIDRTKKINAPESWSDLTDRQFSVCASIYVREVSEYDFVKKFYELPGLVMTKLSKFEIYKLAELADFAMTPEGITNFFFLKKISSTALLAPADRLLNISFEHFALFDTAFFDYVNSPTDDNLVNFVALLYLGKGEVVTEIDFEGRVKALKLHIRLKTVKLADLHSIFLNYIFIHRWLSRSFPALFEEKEPEEQDVTQKQNLKKPAKPNRPNWNEIIDSFVGEDIINYDKYRKMPAIIAFKTINKRIKNNRKNGK